jgi:hypothetical protein
VGMCQESLPTIAFGTEEGKATILRKCEKVIFNQTSETFLQCELTLFLVTMHCDNSNCQQLPGTQGWPTVTALQLLSILRRQLVKLFKTHRCAMDFDSTVCRMA